MSDTNYYKMTHQACASLLIERDKRIVELEAVLKATVPKLNRMMRMPNTEWVADEHNAAVEKLKALLGGSE